MGRDELGGRREGAERRVVGHVFDRGWLRGGGGWGSRGTLAREDVGRGLEAVEEESGAAWVEVWLRGDALEDIRDRELDGGAVVVGEAGGQVELAERRALRLGWVFDRPAGGVVMEVAKIFVAERLGLPQRWPSVKM